MKIGLGFQFVFILISFATSLAWGQGVANASAPSGGSAGYFLGVKTGTFLPQNIRGVGEVLPLWGIKMGHDLSSDWALEYDIDMAHAKGVSYFLGSLGLRHNTVVGKMLPLFFLLGLDAHYYKRRDTYTTFTRRRIQYDFKWVGGWHIGAGSEAVLLGNFFLRSDFRMGFGPGIQLMVAITGLYRF